MKRIFLAILLLSIALVHTTAQVRVGARTGVTLRSLSPDASILGADNTVSYNLGLTAEVGIPIMGLSVDASVLLSHMRNRPYTQIGPIKKTHFAVPLNAKMKFSLLRFIEPYVFTGPEFQILFTRDNQYTDYNISMLGTSWNLGVGVEIMRTLQVSMAYNIGLNRALNEIRTLQEAKLAGEETERCWQLNLTYLF